MKKVLIFSLAYFPKHIGGAEVAIKEITDRISGIEFHLITLRFGADEALEETIGNVRVYRVGNGASYFSKIAFVLNAALAGLRLHRAHRFDAAWAMMSYMSLPLVLMRFLGARIPYVLTLQEGDPFQHVFKRWHIRLIMPFLRKGFKDAAVIQTISTFLTDWARTAGYRGVVEVIPNGVDTLHFSQEYPVSVIDEIQRSLDKKPGDVFLITTSRMVHKNAIDDVIRALPFLPEHVHFIVLGTGIEETALKKLTHEFNLISRVRFVGHVQHSDMPKYLRASDIFIRPSRSEGMGNSFVEAMAAGLPVIATQEGGIADFLFDEKRNPGVATTGWAVDKDSPPQIASAITTILEDPEKARKVTATAKAMVLEKYDWNLIAKDMEERVFNRAFKIYPVA